MSMLLVILMYDQLFFRPLVAWSEKFKFELTESQDAAESLVLTLFQRTRFLRTLATRAGKTWAKLIE